MQTLHLSKKKKNETLGLELTSPDPMRMERFFVVPFQCLDGPPSKIVILIVRAQIHASQPKCCWTWTFGLDHQEIDQHFLLSNFLGW